jgi:hypothetical protein
MKKLTVILIAFLVSSFAHGQAQDSLKKDPNTGTVYFIRSSGVALLMSTFSAFIDDELVCRIDDRHYSTHQLKPGKHYFTVQSGGKKLRQKGQQIDLTIEAGKTYYIQLEVERTLVNYNVVCQEVTENSAKKLLAGAKPQKTCL